MERSVRHLSYTVKFGGEPQRVAAVCNNKLKSPHLLTTENVNNVTCSRCKKTFVYRYLARKIQ